MRFQNQSLVAAHWPVGSLLHYLCVDNKIHPITLNSWERNSSKNVWQHILMNKSAQTASVKTHSDVSWFCRICSSPLPQASRHVYTLSLPNKFTFSELPLWTWISSFICFHTIRVFHCMQNLTAYWLDFFPREQHYKCLLTFQVNI